MRNLRNQDDYWKPCRPGTIYRVTDSKHRRQRRKFAIQMAMGGVVAAAGVFSAMFIALQRKNTGLIKVAENKSIPKPIKLTCKDIYQLTDVYVKAIRQDVEICSEEEIKLISDFDEHLAYCDNCANKVLKALNQV